jgi:hypothetical protein
MGIDPMNNISNNNKKLEYTLQLHYFNSYQPRLLDSDSSRLVKVRRILLFGQRARRRPVVGVARVPSMGPHHRGVEEERAAVVKAMVRREI